MKTFIFICPPEIKLNSLTTTGTHFSQCHFMFSVPVEPLPVNDCAKILYLVCSTKFTREMAASPDICQSADDTLSCFEKKRHICNSALLKAYIEVWRSIASTKFALRRKTKNTLNCAPLKLSSIQRTQSANCAWLP